MAISPVPIAATLILLASRGASTNAASFAAGWITGVAIPLVVFTVLVNALGLTTSRPNWIIAADLVLGVGFLAVATRLLLRRGPRRSFPAWLDLVDRFTPLRAATLGIILAAANPKVLALSLGATIAVGGAGPAAAVSAVIGFVAIGAVGVVAPIAAYLAIPGRGARQLARLRGWLARRERVVLFVLALAIGGFFVQDGIHSLTS